MSLVKLDARGLRSPHPILKIAAMIPQLSEGDVLEVSADCETFETDVRSWCVRMNKQLLSTVSREGITVIQINF